MARIIVTGAAGFIGFHVCRRLLDRGDEVVGIDNLNEYYRVLLKHDRLAELNERDGFRFQELELADRHAVESCFDESATDVVCHLAAQVGVRYSVKNPHAYLDSNLAGFLNVLEGCRSQSVRHLVYASSSSVYGGNRKTPFSVADRVDHPVSLYAATKRAGELMAHSYSHLYNLPATGLRFFTVYGPWGRPDMAVWKFTESMLAGRTIPVYNHGQMRRDFTFVDDVADAVVRALDRPPRPSSTVDPETAANGVPHRVYNIGNNCPVELEELITTLESTLGVQANREMLPMQAGDVLETYADIDAARRDLGFEPKTPLAEGLKKFVDWYRPYAERSQERARISDASDN